MSRAPSVLGRARLCCLVWTSLALLSACQSSHRTSGDDQPGGEPVDASALGTVDEGEAVGRAGTGEMSAAPRATPQVVEPPDAKRSRPEQPPDATVAEAPIDADDVDASGRLPDAAAPDAAAPDAAAVDAAVAIDAATVPPLSLAPCPGEDATLCPDSDPLCLYDTGAGGGSQDGSFFMTWSVCTRFCQTDDDCPSEFSQARCVERGRDRVCVIDCSFGRSCPGQALSCSRGDNCAHFACTCRGTGCDDPLCLAP